MNRQLENSISAVDKLTAQDVYSDAMLSHLFGALSLLFKHQTHEINGNNFIKVNELMETIHRSYNYAKKTK